LKSRIIRKILLLFLVSFLVLAAEKTAMGQMASTNWAGYAVNSAGITAISASWIIPEVNCVNTIGGNQVTQGAAVWIGVDGLTGTALVPEQVGTNSICYNGSAVYYAWEEDPTVGPGTANHNMVVNFGQEISAGERITASIAYLGNNRFRMTIADIQADESKTWDGILVPNAPRTSAEWIVEAPYNMNTGKQLVLPDSKPIAFTDCSASVNNAAGSIVQLKAEPINMVDKNDKIIAAPQSLNQAGTSFNVVVASPVPEFPTTGLLLVTTLFTVLVIFVLRRNNKST
jgi:Peptidase A4 family